MTDTGIIYAFALQPRLLFQDPIVKVKDEGAKPGAFLVVSGSPTLVPAPVLLLLVSPQHLLLVGDLYLLDCKEGGSIGLDACM